MKKPKFKGVRPESYINDPIVWAITEEMLQVEAEHILGRQLTDKELNRVCCAIGDDEDINWHHMVLIQDLVSCIADNSKNQWDGWDN